MSDKCDVPEPWWATFGKHVGCELPPDHEGNHRHGLDVWFRSPIVFRHDHTDEGGWPRRDSPEAAP